MSGKRRLAVAGLAAAVVGAGAALALGVAGDGGPALPAGVSEPGGGIAVGNGGEVVVDEWFDFACPACADSSAELMATIDALLDSEQITVVYHPLSFVTPTGSAAAANALGCAADHGKAKEFHDAALAHDDIASEPTADELISLGAAVGIDNAGFSSCVSDSTYAEWVQAVTASAQSAGVAVTPTYAVDGEQVALTGSRSRALADAVAAATDHAAE